MNGIKIIREQKICKNCGHKEQDHNSWGTACYKFIKKGKATFECSCKKFEEKEKFVPLNRREEEEMERGR